MDPPNTSDVVDSTAPSVMVQSNTQLVVRSGPGAAKALLHKELFEKYHQIYRFECELLNQRLGFYLISQAFLLSAYFTLFSAAACEEPNRHVPCTSISYFVTAVGFSLCVIHFLGTLPMWLAVIKIDHLANKTERKLLTPHWHDGPLSRTMWILHFAPILIPCLFIALWWQLFPFF